VKCFSHPILLFRRTGLGLLLVACLGAGVWNAYADEVILTNADRISGRLISLSPQTVRIATSHSGTIEIDRKHLQQLETDNPMVVELVSGERLIGRIGAAGEKDIVIHSPALGDCPLSLVAVESITAYMSDENINKKALQDGSQEVFKVVESDSWRLNKEKYNLSAQLQDVRGKGVDALKASDETEEKSTDAAKPPKPIGPRPEDEDDIRRIFLRQSSVLLKAGEMEFEAGFNYLGNQVSATVYNARIRQFQLPLSFRIGIFERVEGFVSIPFAHAEQEISFASDSITERTTGVGDASLGINYEMYRETAQWPDITTALTIRAPTGDEPDEDGLSICSFFLIGIAFYGCSTQTSSTKIQSISLKTGWTRAEKALKSWKALRDQNVVIQRYDYSCGAGALATLMRYYFGDQVSEEEILLSILEPMTHEQVLDREKNGLSLLDLKHCAEQRGYHAVGVKLNYASLKRLKGPVLVHLEREGYKHFAVLKGVRGDRIYLADPSRGNIRMSVFCFAQEWTGVALVLGKKGFGLPQSYPLALIDQELGQNEMQDARRSLFTK
jgi:predicted double-glycine peptidase